MAKKTPTSTILVPVDFSPHSKEALLFAAKLAERLVAPLVILHVIHDPGDAPGYYPQKDPKHPHRIPDIAAEMMADFIKKTAEENPSLPTILQAEIKMVTGLPVTRIIEVAEQYKPQMVVMGSKGRTGLAHLLLGSKAEQVVRLCPFPVTIIKMQDNKE